MLFSSPIFLFYFLPALIAVMLVAGRSIRMQNALLLIASVIFYAWGEGLYLFLLITSILLNYLFGLALVRWRSRLVFIIGIVINLGILMHYKYEDFIIEIINYFLQALEVSSVLSTPNHLPIGISFFTFQAITYLVDVYTRKHEAQKNPFHLALYISFFPQLLAGPIVRYNDFASQITERRVSLKDIDWGARLFVIGLAKKLLLADQLGDIADMTFALETTTLSSNLAWLGAICFTLQIYFDFSGYSDMAIGLARMFGFTLKINFNYPYIAQSLTDLWQRWHISMTSLARDYIYTPLATRQARKKPLRHFAAPLLITMLIIGLWHGAAWKFILFGAVHGVALLIEQIFSLQTRTPRIIRHIYVLLLWVFGCVLFRATDLSHFFSYSAAMLGFAQVKEAFPFMIDTALYLTLCSALIASTPLLVQLKSELMGSNSRLKYVFCMMVRECGYVLILLLSLMSMASSTIDNFIYFRF